MDRMKVEDARKAMLAAKEVRDQAQGLLNDAVQLFAATLPGIDDGFNGIELPGIWETRPNDAANDHFNEMKPWDHDDHTLIMAEYVYDHLDEIEADIAEAEKEKA